MLSHDIVLYVVKHGTDYPFEGKVPSKFVMKQLQNAAALCQKLGGCFVHFSAFSLANLCVRHPKVLFFKPRYPQNNEISKFHNFHFSNFCTFLLVFANKSGVLTSKMDSEQNFALDGLILTSVRPLVAKIMFFHNSADNFANFNGVEAWCLCKNFWRTAVCQVAWSQGDTRI